MLEWTQARRATDAHAHPAGLYPMCRKTRPLPPEWYLPLQPGMVVSESGDFYIEHKGIKVTHSSIREDVRVDGCRAQRTQRMGSQALALQS